MYKIDRWYLNIHSLESTMSTSDLHLSPDQQHLLLAALNSNKPSNTVLTTQGTRKQDHNNHFQSFTSTDMSDFTAPGSGHLDFSDDSPYLDFGLDGEVDDSFDYDEAGRMIGDLPEESPLSDLHDKRKSIDGRDEDDEGNRKRREGDDKMAKKPGRKPLTSEPTTVIHLYRCIKVLLTRYRNERHKTVQHNVHSEKGKSNI